LQLSTLIRYQILLFALILGFMLLLPHPVQAEDWGYWSSWQVRERAGVVINSEEKGVISDILREIKYVFQEPPALNPPLEVRVKPIANIFPPALSFSQEKNIFSYCLDLGMTFPLQGRLGPSGRISVWVNDPEALLGTSIGLDENGPIYMLPPVIEERSSGPLYSRSAHPVGYTEAFPSRSFFPLWNMEVEPFLREKIKPTFSLSRASVATVLTPDKTPFWEPVSQKRWIEFMQKQARLEIELFLKQVQAARDDSHFHQQAERLERQIAFMEQQYSPEKVLERHEQALEDLGNSLKMFRMHKEMAQTEEVKEKWAEAIAEVEENKVRAEAYFLEEFLLVVEDFMEEMQEYLRDLALASLQAEEMLEEAAEIVKNSRWDQLEELGQKYDSQYLLYLADSGRAQAKLEAELASLSPAELSAPAYGFEIPPTHPVGPYRHLVPMDFEVTRPSGLVDKGTEGARALVALKPGFFTDALPSTAPRLIIVKWWELIDSSHFSPEGRHFHPARREMMDRVWSDLRWDQIYNLLP